MTTPLICALAAFALNYLTKLPLMIAMKNEKGGYDNKNPREQQSRLKGWGKRALGAHQNSFEVTPLFACCVIIGHLTNGNAQLSSVLAITFLLSRVLYTALYLANLDMLRSLVWMLGIAASFGIGLSSFL